MARTGGIFKRCGCKDPVTGRRLDRACPRLVCSTTVGDMNRAAGFIASREVRTV